MIILSMLFLAFMATTVAGLIYTIGFRAGMLNARKIITHADLNRRDAEKGSEPSAEGAGS